MALVMLGLMLLSVISCTINLSKFYHGARTAAIIEWTIASFILIGFYFLSVAFRELQRNNMQYPAGIVPHTLLLYLHSTPVFQMPVRDRLI